MCESCCEFAHCRDVSRDSDDALKVSQWRVACVRCVQCDRVVCVESGCSSICGDCNSSVCKDCYEAQAAWAFCDHCQEPVCCHTTDSCDRAGSGSEESGSGSDSGSGSGSDDSDSDDAGARASDDAGARASEKRLAVAKRGAGS